MLDECICRKSAGLLVACQLRVSWVPVGCPLSVNPELRVNRSHLSTGGGGGESAHPVSLKTD